MAVSIEVYVVYNLNIASTLGPPDPQSLLLHFLALLTLIIPAALLALNALLQLRYVLPNSSLLLGSAGGAEAMTQASLWS